MKWKIKKLGEVCDVVGGGTPSKTNPGFYNGDIPWATVRDMKNDVIESTEYKITKGAVKNSSSNIIPKSNVIIATRVGLGKVCFVKNDTAINQDLRGIIPKNTSELSVQYLFWWLKSIAHVIEANGTGATVQGVKLPFIKGLEIPVPPLNEQERIVKFLNEVSEKIETVRGNERKKLASLDELKKSILKKTFLGGV